MTLSSVLNQIRPIISLVAVVFGILAALKGGS